VVADGNDKFVTGDAVYDAIEAAKTAANTYADGLNTEMDTRVGNLEAAKAAQDTTNGQLNKAISDEVTARENAISGEATARENADNAINAKIGGSFDATNTVAKAISDAETNAVAAAKTETEKQVKALVDGQVASNAAEITRVDGLVTALKAGEVTIRVALTETIYDEITLTIKAPVINAELNADSFDLSGIYQDDAIVKSNEFINSFVAFAGEPSKYYVATVTANITATFSGDTWSRVGISHFNKTRKFSVTTCIPVVAELPELLKVTLFLIIL
jgi:hypothetical protein